MLYPNAASCNLCHHINTISFPKSRTVQCCFHRNPPPPPPKNPLLFCVEILMLNQLFKGNTVDLLIDVSKSIQ